MQVLLVFYFFSLPFFFFRGFFEHSEFPKALLSYFILFLLLLFFLKRNLSNLRLNSLDLGILAFLLFITLSSLFAGSVKLALFGLYPYPLSLLFILFLTILHFILKDFFADKKNFSLFLISTTGGLLISCLFGIVSYFGQYLKDFNPTLRATSTEQNAIFFGMLMLLGFFFSFAFAAEKGRKLLYFIPTIFFLGMIISFSRGVFISLSVGLAVLTLLVLTTLKIRLRTYKYTIIFILIGLIILFTLQQPILSRIYELANPSPTTSHSIRIQELKDSLKIFKEKSLPMGIGIGHFSLIYPQYRSAKHNLTSEWNLYPRQVRNNYLDLAIATGPLSFLAFLFTIFLACFAIKESIKRENYPAEKLKLIIVFSCFAALLTHGLFYFYNITAWVYLYVLLAFFSALNKKPLIQLVIPEFLIKASVLTFSLLGFAILFKIILAETYFMKGLRFYNQISYLKDYPSEEMNNILFTNYAFPPQDFTFLQKAQENFSKAKSVSPFYNPVYGRQSLHTISLQARLESDQEIKTNLYKKAYSLARTNLQKNSEDYLNYRISSSIAFRIALENIERESYLKQAIVNQERVAILDPSNPINFDNLGLMYREAGQLDTARLSFEKALTLKKDYLQSYIHLGETLEALDKTEATKVYREALMIFQENQILKDKLKKLEEQN